MSDSFEQTIQSAGAPGPDRKLAGISFFAATPSGVRYNRSFGTTTIAPDAPELQDDAVMHLMSCTKLVTSIAALQCVERGLLDLDANAEALLPELGRTRILKGFAEGGSPILEPAKEAITLRRLLTHTSGFAFEFLSPGAARANRALGFAPHGSRAGVLVRDHHNLQDDSRERCYTCANPLLVQHAHDPHHKS